VLNCPLAYVVPALYLIPLAFILVLALFVIRALRWTRAERILFVPIVVMFLLCIVITMIAGYVRNRQLWAELMARQSASTLVFRGNAHKVTVSDPDEIAAFFRLLKEARRVSAHHSYPVNKIELTVGKDGYRYSIGPDSDRADEFWIDDLSCGDSYGGRTIAQVQSYGLAEYLRKLKVLKPRPKR